MLTGRQALRPDSHTEPDPPPLGRYSRQLVLGVLGAGLVLVSLVVYGSVTLRRSDFGRRRALGATRSTIIGLVATQYLIVATAGALVGSLSGNLLVTRLTGGPPNISFVAAITTLAVVTSLAASLPPAAIAAH